jgi:hypothetical protein
MQPCQYKNSSDACPSVSLVNNSRGISLLHKAAKEHTEKIAENKCVD